jgi:hypothetical protein
LDVDNERIGQSGAITRFLARKFNLYGQGEMDAARCDEIYDTFRDGFEGHFTYTLWKVGLMPEADGVGWI